MKINNGKKINAGERPVTMGKQSNFACGWTSKPIHQEKSQNHQKASAIENINKWREKIKINK